MWKGFLKVVLANTMDKIFGHPIKDLNSYILLIQIKKKKKKEKKSDNKKQSLWKEN